MLRHPKNKLNSSALGRYQIVRTTLREIRKTLDLSPIAKFDAGMQDRMACFLLGRRGIDRFLAGSMSRTEIIEALALEWASLPKSNGKGAYDGQHAAVGPGAVGRVLAEVQLRARGKSTGAPVSEQERVPTTSDAVPTPDAAPAPAPDSGKSDPVIIDRPVVADPGELETHPLKSKTFWQWIITSIIVPFLTVFQDWRVQSLILIIVAAFAVYAIKRRFDLFNAVRRLMSEHS